MAPRLFTLAEANALLPEARKLVAQMLMSRQEILDTQADLWPAAAKAMSNGGGKTLSAAARQILSIQNALMALDDMGIQVKDINTGLIDFPARYRDRVVLLCWQWDEPSILFWHEVDAGFAGRRPIGEWEGR